ncbi:MAG: CHAT domain-containing protein, partial [Proteobacteria bacterium]|nr:CHAT domain-containing protein [Pseudomonadota bacterium]MBU2453355.1 CHAT domain-containing protein [Pseudomonadota bacterium]
GHVEDTMNSITFFINNLKPFLGAKQYYSSEILGIRGMANFKMKKEKQAFNDFAKAIPLLFKEKTDEGDYLKTFRRRLIIESYLDLLVGIKESGREKEFNIQVAPIIFDLCERLNNSVVEGALGASGARAAANDPELADLVRKEQDATKQIDAIKQSITNIVGASADELNKLAISDLKANLNALTMAKNAFLEEIQIRFPKYIDFINPQPKGFFQVQNTLRNKEAMVIIYPFSTRTFIWGVPQSGHATFKIKSVNENDLKKEILRLRKSLAPDPEVFGDIPEFEFDLVHGLFTQLLKPVEASWQDAQDLLIVAPGSLGQIPFGILTTSKVILKKEKTLLYETYRDVPWLIKKVSISRIPSVAALVTLRSLPEASLDRKAFVGFGDPIFNLQQLSQEKKEKPHKIASRGVSLHVRGIKKVETDITTEKTSMNLSDLNRLPDTADEILSIANVLGADMVNDIFIGENASETNVKKVDLSNTKTIAFASHGLIPGDLDGLIQPAIALCSPEVTKDFDEDGLLTMGEILKLNLNADWVILSACNTGVGDGEGAEAVSGLGRSFFYAGARALLVTMWPVETTSAKLLTTGLFKYQKNDPGLSRAKALQASIVDLIDHQTLKDGETGKDIASYAHPFFWAPFIVVGDGG